MVHRTFKTLSKNKENREAVLMKQFVIFGMFTVFVGGIVPYGNEVQALILMGIVFVPELTVGAFYAPVSNAIETISKPLKKRTETVCIYLQTRFMRIVRMHITTSWGRNGWLDATRLNEVEYGRVLKSLRDLASEVFREKRRRMKIHFTSSRTTSTLNKEEEGSERDILGNIQNKGVMRTPPKPRTEKKRRRMGKRRFGTMMPRSKPLFADDDDYNTTNNNDENENIFFSKDIFTEPRPPGRYVSPSKCSRIPLGTCVYVELGRNVVRKATLRFCGKTEFYSGEWVGVELKEDSSHGKNDGSVQGVRYFDCAPMRGLFVRPQVISLISPLEKKTNNFEDGDHIVRRRLIS